MGKPVVKKFVPPAASGTTDDQMAHQTASREPSVAANEPSGAAVKQAVSVTTRQPGKPTAAQTLAEMELRVTRQRRILNLVKSVMPIVRSIVVNPGAHASAADKANAINKMTRMATDASALLMAEVAPDLMEKGWANAESFRFCASIVGAEWQQSGSLDGANALLNHEFVSMIAAGFADADAKALKWLELSGNTPPIKSETDAATRIRLSLLKAAAPLALDVHAFSFWRQHLGGDEVKRLIASLTDRLSAVAAENANRQADDYGMDADNRIMLWQGAIARSFEIAREEYRTLANKAMSEVDAAADSKAKSSIRKAWATGEKGDVATLVAKTADNMIRLLDGIVSRTVNDAFEADRKDNRGMKP